MPAGLLHDVLDKTATIGAELERRFGACIAQLVESVSDDPSIGDYEERELDLRDRVARADSETFAIFAADKIAKVRELAPVPRSRHTKLRAEPSSRFTARALRRSAESQRARSTSTVSTPSSYKPNAAVSLQRTRLPPA
ncbi:MAG: hypothetical protein ACXVH3_22350 [Solirubrobacteraceae bacterium]